MHIRVTSANKINEALSRERLANNDDVKYSSQGKVSSCGIRYGAQNLKVGDEEPLRNMLIRRQSEAKIQEVDLLALL